MDDELSLVSALPMFDEQVQTDTFPEASHSPRVHSSWNPHAGFGAQAKLLVPKGGL